MQEDWSRKGATLSDKTAPKEFGLTQDEIVAAIDAGRLQCRVGVIQEHPWLRLLRREVGVAANVVGLDRLLRSVPATSRRAVQMLCSHWPLR